jgi:hypothetical protein
VADDAGCLGFCYYKAAQEHWRLPEDSTPTGRSEASGFRLRTPARRQEKATTPLTLDTEPKLQKTSGRNWTTTSLSSEKLVLPLLPRRRNQSLLHLHYA